jgi:hypothetical protein
MGTPLLRLPEIMWLRKETTKIGLAEAVPLSFSIQFIQTLEDMMFLPYVGSLHDDEAVTSRLRRMDKRDVGPLVPNKKCGARELWPL